MNSGSESVSLVRAERGNQTALLVDSRHQMSTSSCRSAGSGSFHVSSLVHERWNRSFPRTNHGVSSPSGSNGRATVDSSSLLVLGQDICDTVTASSSVSVRHTSPSTVTSSDTSPVIRVLCSSILASPKTLLICSMPATASSLVQNVGQMSSM